MPVNKYALMRYKTLNKCFSNRHKRYTINELISECIESMTELNPDASVSRSQIYADINFMKSDQGWSIELKEDFKDGKKTLYRYVDPNFSIDTISKEEKEIFNHMLMTLTRMKGSNIDRMFKKNILDDLFDKFGVDLKSIKNNPFVIFEKTHDQSSSFFPDIFLAIKEKRVLDIIYKPFNGMVRELTVHPYYLKEIRGVWHLHCRDINNEIIFHLALDCFVRCDFNTDKSITYIESSLTAEQYFKDIIGNDIKPTKLTKVELKINDDYMSYIENRPIHDSQKIVNKNWSKTHTLVTLTIKPNYDFFDAILSHGNNIEIICPNNLRKNIEIRTRRIYNQYN